MASTIVETLSESTILPTVAPSEKRTHFLSNLDLIFDNQIFYAQIVFLFRDVLKDGASKEELMASLKASAAKLLDAFPVLAGRLTKQAEQQNRTAVDVNGAGIPFFEARTSAKLSDWDELRHCDIDLKLNPSNDGIPIEELQSAPIIRLQATLFADRGLSLGFSAMHLLVDGANTIDVLKAWGELHRGAPAPSKLPRFETHLLAAREPPRVTTPLPANLSFFDGDFAFESIAKKKLARHTFFLPSESVDALVAEVSSGSSYKYGRVSSYEAVSALFWSCIARARSDTKEVTSNGHGNNDNINGHGTTNGVTNGNAVTHFTIPVSLTRPGRIDPQLPEGYFGNAVIMTLATSIVDSIAHEHMSFAARLIHDRAQSYEPELAKSVIDQLEIRLRQGKSLGISIGEGPPSGLDVLSTSLTSFPVYEIEFGFGKLAQCIFSFPLDIGEGLISTLPVPGGGRGRHVAVCLQQKHMDQLLRDPVFTTYCRF